MRNKTIHIILSFLLVISTVGVTVAKHYCGNSLVSVSIYNNHKACCGEGCKSCRTEHNTFKVTDNYVVSSTSLLHVTELIQIFVVPVNETFTFGYNTNSSLSILLKTPPLILQSNSLLQVFRC